MAKKVQLQTNGKEWQVIDGEQVLVDVGKQDIDPITSSSCVQIEGFRTLEEAVSDNKMLSQDLTYTKVMDKVGGDYHQNVLDGQYSKAILYGNTQVNLCEEDTSNTLTIPTTFTSFNNDELQIKNKESQVVAPLIKGMTMVNLAQINSSSVASGKGVPIQNVKGNTVYTLSFAFSTKNTNSGVVIECYDVNGEYLGNVMHKTGLGDIVKFTFTTHANATKIHICNNAAYGGETIQLDEIMLIEGDQTTLDIPFFKGMRSVELSRPLTNLFTNDTGITSEKTTFTNTDGNVVVTSSSSSSWCHINIVLNKKLKPNTKYLVMWDNLTATQTSASNTEALISVYGTGNVRLGYINNNSLCPTKRSIIFDTANHDISQIKIRIHATLNNTETGTTTVTGLRVFEYDDYLRSVDLQSIGWFSGTKNVAVEPIKTCSKNLYPYGDVSFTSSGSNWYDAKGNINMYGDIASKSKSRFLLKKGTYTLSIGSTQNIEQYGLVDDKETTYSNTFTLSQDTYMTLRFKRIQAETLTTATNIQIERGETATDYVAHDSRYYEPNGQNAIVLRSLPSGVCDTFNLQTGEYVRRIGEVIFDGSEEWTQNGNGNYAFFTTKQDSKPSSTIVCDKLKEITGWNNYSEKGIFRGTQAFGIVVTSNELTTCNVETFKTWLSQNPITVQYELDTPITTIIPRTIKRNNNGAVSTIDFGTYTNKENLRLPNNPSYLTINSMTSIKPVVEPITYVDFKTRLKANTDYSVIIDKDSANKTINLGGTSKTYADKMLVRTPSINLEQNLRISGSGTIQNIMVIEGDVLDKELPYFNGMCNVKMPIVKNIGKNLFDIQSIYQGLKNIAPNNVLLLNDNTLQIKSTAKWYKKDLGKPIKFKENTRYTLSFYAKDISNVEGLPDIIICFVYTDGTTNYSRTWGDNVLISNAGKTVDYINFSFGYGDGSMIEFSNFMLVEGTEAQPYEPYKENSVYAVQGEIGLSQDMFEQGTTAPFVANPGKTYQWLKENSMPSFDVRRLRLKELIKIQPNTKLILQNTDNFMYAIAGYDANKLSLGTFDTSWIQNTTITIPQDAHYISFSIRKKDDTNITIDDFKQTNFVLLKLDEIINLRSLPNGVKDELNLSTGEYIQRVGETVFDGSDDEDWQLYDKSIGGSKYFRIGMSVMKTHDDANALCTHTICDKLENVPYYTGIYNMSSRPDSVIAFAHSIILNAQAMFVYQTGNQGDLVQFKQWLQQNPLTIQYELAEPIISYPRIVSNTQEREVGVKLPNGVCDTYNPSTGITVKRVGKAILDGSESWIQGGLTNDTYFEAWLPKSPLKDMKFSYEGFMVGYFTNMIKIDGWAIPYEPTIELIDGKIRVKCGIANDLGAVSICILKSKLPTQDVDGFKAYLKSNPLTVYYELANPIVTTDIVLPNRVHDEYNPLTGLYTKRVECIEFDGSENWRLGTTKTNTQVFELIMLNEKLDVRLINNIICDKLPTSDGSLSDTEKIAYTDSYVNNATTMSIYIALLKTKASTLNELKTYLSQNPIKVWYELSTPITYQLTPYFGLPMPYAYKDGYLIMDSAYDGQTLPPEITYQLTINRTGQITQNNIKLKEHTARLSNLEYILIEATLDSIFDREMQNFELELMNVELFNLDE